MRTLATSLLAACLCLLAGCTAFYRPTVREVAPRMIVTNAEVVTNFSLSWVPSTQYLTVSTSLPPVECVLTNPVVVQTISTQVTYKVSPAVTETNWSVRPELLLGLEVAKAAPVPWAGTAASVLTGVLGLGAAWLNGRKREVAEKALRATVTGVEIVRRSKHLTPEQDAALVGSLAVQQRSAQVEAIVKAVADSLGRTKA